jgi:hypothetical protein
VNQLEDTLQFGQQRPRLFEGEMMRKLMHAKVSVGKPAGSTPCVPCSRTASRI